MRRLGSILFWSVLSAAFIGPGTVTTATRAGHDHGTALLWALTFSTFACIVLQEAAARAAIGSGNDLARALRKRFEHSPMRWPVVLLLLVAIVGGCAAYEAGNLLGAISGLEVVFDVPRGAATLVLGSVAAAFFLVGGTRVVIRALGFFVALMGFLFLWTAVQLRPDAVGIVKCAFVPAFPEGSALLIAGLIGTTVVPYNLFLGSGMAVGSRLGEMRLGLFVAIALGGVISMGVLVAGTAVQGIYSLGAVAESLATRAGRGAEAAFGIGLLAAGLSSAITAPLAAAITAEGLLGTGDRAAADRSGLAAGVFLFVLAFGVVCGALGLRPVPAIVLAQAANGILLPFVAFFLVIALNDRSLPPETRNTAWQNGLLLLVVAVALYLGARSVAAAAAGFRELIG